MSNEKYYKEESKKEWFTTGGITEDRLKLGCLMRIADATEKMVEPYKDLIEKAETEERWRKDAEQRNRRLSNRIAGLKGYIKRLKRGNESQ